MSETKEVPRVEERQTLVISLTTEPTLEQIRDSSGYIQFLSKHDADGLVIYFFNDKSHPLAIRHNKSLLGLSHLADLDASRIFYDHDYKEGITGGQIYRNGDGEIENIFFSSNCEAISYKELKAIVMQLLDPPPLN